MNVSDELLDRLSPLIAADNAALELVVDGRYEVLSRIARGGMGEVFRARDLRLGRDVAMKVVADELSSAVWAERFQEEARLMARIDHPGVVPIHDLGRLPDGRLFYTMKLVEGRTLDALLAAGTSRRELVRVLAQVGSVTQQAHDRGIVHRDLKPGNVMIGANEQVYVLDWGIARVLDEARAEGAPGVEALTGRTSTGAILGTLEYMPPEQARGDTAAIGPRSDVYALGAILYEILTRRPPRRAAATAALIEKALRAEPAAPRSIDPTVPRDLEAVCLKAMEKNASERYASARDFGEDLRRWLEGDAVRAPVPSLGYRFRKFVARRRAVVATAAAGLLAALALAAWMLPRWRAEALAAEGERTLRREDAGRRERARPYLAEGDRLLQELRLRAREPRCVPADLVPLVERAVAEFRKALGAYPDLPEALLGAARACRLGGDDAKASDWVERALRASPGFAPAYVERLRLRVTRFERDRHGDAAPERSEYETQLAADLKAVETHAQDLGERLYGAAVLAFSRNDHAKAASLLAEYLLTAPGDWVARTLRGHSMAHLERLDEAEAELSEAIRLCAFNADAFGFRARVRISRELWDAAIEDAERAIRLAPDDPWHLALRAEARVGRKDWTGALRDLDRCVALRPTNLHFLDDRGLVKLALGDEEGALDDFERSRGLGSTHRHQDAAQAHAKLRELKLRRRPDSLAPASFFPLDSRARPEDEALRRAAERVRATYRAEYVRGSPANLRAFARKLLVSSGEHPADPPLRFALLDESRLIAAQGGDAGGALVALDRMARDFDVDVLPLKLAACAAVPASGEAPGWIAAAAGLALDVAEDALRAERFDLASEAAERARAMAAVAGDAKAVEAARRLSAELKELRAEREAAADDGARGAWLCLKLGDWAAGLPLLAKDPGPLGEAAQLDLGAPRSSRRLVKAAAAWRAAAAGRPERDRRRLLERASLLLNRAMETTDVLDAARAEPELERLESEPGAPLHLLRRIEPARDAVQKSEFSLTPLGLVSPAKRTRARLSIPYLPPEEYDLLVEAERKEGNDLLGFGLPTPRDTALVILDGSGLRDTTAIFFVDGRGFADNATTLKGPRLDLRRPVELRLAVRRTGITLWLDGRRLISQHSPTSRYGNWPEMDVTRKDLIFLCSVNSRFLIRRLDLLPVSGAGRWVHDAAVPEALATPVDPAGAEAVAAEARVRAMLEEDASWTSGAAATRLLRASARAAAEPPLRRALLLEAERRALEAGDVETALLALGALARVEGREPRLLPRVPEGAVLSPKSARVLLALGQGALRAKRLDEAEGAARAARAALPEEAAYLLAQVERRKSAGSDGRSLCFVLGDWPAGLRALAASDSPLAEAARADLAGRGDAGDLWWAAAETDGDPHAAHAMRRRAGAWYERSLPEAPEAERARRRARIREIPAKAPDVVDLLPRIDPAAHAIDGAWSRDGSALANRANEALALLRVPVEPPRDYELLAEVERLSGRHAFGLGLAWEDRSFAAMFDGWAEDRLSGLDLVDGKGGDVNETTLRRSGVLPAGRPALVHASVREGRVIVRVDGEKLMDWRGSMERLSRHPCWPLPNPRELWLCSWRHSRQDSGVFHVRRLALVRVPPDGAEELPAVPVDLLPRIDPARDAVSGVWRVDPDGALLCEKSDWCRLQIPYEAPDEYDLTLVVTRVHGPDALNLGLTRRGRQFCLSLDSWGGNTTGLALLDGKLVKDSVGRIHRVLLKQGKESTVVASVRSDGVTLYVDGEKVFEWKGDYERLKRLPGMEAPSQRTLVLGSWNSRFRVSKLQLTPIAGEGRFLR